MALTNIYEFMSDSPILAFFIAAFSVQFFYGLFVRLPVMVLRHMNIRKHGYPPAHCDVDGDFVLNDKD